jgi:NifB/MoaA-like Fe-S oxidoreductase
VKAIAQIERARARAGDERNVGWAYAGDEMFYIAGKPIPDRPYYDDGLLTENGVGAVRSFLSVFEANLPRVPRLSGSSVAIVTGERMGSVIGPLAERLSSAAACTVDTIVVRNEYFGSTVTTAGLLAGMDILDAMQVKSGRPDIVLIPADALNDDDRFIDDVPLADVAAALSPARVIAAQEIATALIPL